MRNRKLFNEAFVWVMEQHANAVEAGQPCAPLNNPPPNINQEHILLLRYKLEGEGLTLVSACSGGALSVCKW